MTNTPPPTREWVWNRLRSLLVEIGEVSPESAREDASIDVEIKLESVAFVEIAVILEEELDIELDPLEILDRPILGQIADYIWSCTQESEVAAASR